MPRLNVGSAYLTLHADSTQLERDVVAASRDASTRAHVTVDVIADTRRMDQIRRQIETLTATQQRGAMAASRAQQQVNQAQADHAVLLNDSTTSAGDLEASINRIARAQLDYDDAVRRTRNSERDRAELQREQSETERSIRRRLREGPPVPVRVEPEVDNNRVRRTLVNAFDGFGRIAGTLFSQGLGAALSVVGDMATSALSNVSRSATQAGSSVAASTAAGAAGFGEMTAATGGLNIVIGALVIGLGALWAVTGGLVVGFLALAPAIAIVTGGMGIAVMGAIALGSAFATLKLAFGGAMEALQAHGAMEDEVAQKSSKGASQARSNAVAIRNASEAIADARARAADAVENGNKRIADAEKALSRAREDAAERTADAEKNLTGANEDAQEALEKLNDERAEAIDRIKELAQESADAALGEERAQLRLVEAKNKLLVIESHLALGTGQYTDLDKADALLDIKEATNDLTKSQIKAVQAAQDSAKATAAGVEGDKKVLDAKEALEKAQDKQSESVKDLAKAQRDSAEMVADAEDRLTESRADAAKAQSDANKAIDKAVQSLADMKAAQAEAAQSMDAGSGAADKFNKAMSELTPAGRAFVYQMLEMKKGLDELKRTAETAVLPGVTQFLKDAAGLFPIINGHIKNMGEIIGGAFRRVGDYIASDLFKGQLKVILKNAEEGFQGIADALVAFIPAFVSVTEAAAPLFSKFGKWLKELSEGFAAWIEKKRESGELASFFETVGGLLSKMVHTGELVFGIIGEIIEILFPQSAQDSGGMLDGINRALERFLDWLKDPRTKQEIREFIGKIEKFAIDCVTIYLPKIVEMFTTIEGWVEKLKGWAKDFNKFKEDTRVIWETLANITKAQWLLIKTFIIDPITTAFRTVTGLWESFKLGWDTTWKWVSDTTTRWTNSIKSTISGLKDHFVSVFSNIAGPLVGPLNTIIDVINNAISKFNLVIPNDIPLVGKISLSGTGIAAGLNARAEGGPVFGPGTGTSDDIPVMVSNGEYVVRAGAVRKLGLGVMDYINNIDRRGDVGGDVDTLRVKPQGAFADGGLVQRTQDFIRAQDPKPYVWAAVGPNAYDCSGLVGQIWAMLTGHPSYRRYFTTHNVANGFGFKPGHGTFTIGLSDSHVRGNLAGLAFEAASTRSGIKVGSTSGSVDSMPRQYYLPEMGSGFVSGGGGGGGGGGGLFGGVIDFIGMAKKTMRDALTKPFDDAVARVLRPLGVPGQAATEAMSMGKNRLIDMASVFDQGGLWPSGTIGINRSGRTERVLTADQEDARLRGSAAPVINNYFNVMIDPKAVKEFTDVTSFFEAVTTKARQNSGGRRMARVS